MFSLLEAARHLASSVELPHPELTARGACIDSRKLKEGDLFVALPGTRTDGHAFLEQVFAAKACGALVNRSVFTKRRDTFREQGFKNLIPVDDPAQALTSLAAWHRAHYPIPRIGITGSVGKTSTKELLYYLLCRCLPAEQILVSQGNFNNQLGLPLTLLSLHQGLRLCVAELGANRPGDIADLCRVLKPTAAILTKVAPAHLEGFGSLEAVYDTKLALLASLPEKAPAVIPYGDPIMEDKIKGFPLRIIRVGKDARADYCVSDVRTSRNTVSFTLNGRHAFEFPGSAAFFAENAAMALAIIEASGFSLDTLPRVWRDFSLPEGRFTPKTIGGGVSVIDDGYNASPASFRAALESFSKMDTQGRKMIVFSDMLELGDSAAEYHRELGREIATYSFDGVFAYGPLSREAIEEVRRSGAMAGCAYFPEAGELGTFLEGYLKTGDLVLFKASRGMKIDEVIQRLASSPRFLSSGFPVL